VTAEDLTPDRVTAFAAELRALARDRTSARTAYNTEARVRAFVDFAHEHGVDLLVKPTSSSPYLTTTDLIDLLAGLDAIRIALDATEEARQRVMAERGDLRAELDAARAQIHQEEVRASEYHKAWKATLAELDTAHATIGAIQRAADEGTLTALALTINASRA
jgi:hypothetical protein